MSGRIHELLNRNLQEVFGEGEAARRRAAIEELYTDDCYSICLPASSSGTMHWTSSQETCVRPTLTSSTRLTASMQALHNAGRLALGSGPRGEKLDYTGLDVIIVRGDEIAALYVFLDSMPS